MERYLEKIIMSQKKFYLLILIILTILSTFTVTLLSIYNSFGDLIDNMLLRLIPTMGIFVALFLTLMINKYFINYKKEEFSIILLSGCRNKEIIKYILIQFCLLFLISDSLGFGLGIILNNILDKIYPSLLQYHIIEVGYYYLAIIFCKMIYICFINYGVFIRIKLSIADYLTNHSQKTSKLSFNLSNKKTIKEIFISLIGIAFIVLSMMGLFDSSSLLFVYYSLFLIGLLIIVVTTIPFIFDLIHDRYLLNNNIWLMALSYFINFSNVLISDILVLLAVIPFCLVGFFIDTNNNLLINVSTINYFINLIMIFICFILHFKVYLPDIYKDIAVKRAIGFTSKEIKTIYTRLALIFIFMIDIIPCILYSIMLYQSYINNIINKNMMFILIISYLLCFIIFGIYMLYQYNLSVREVYEDVRYLNRSE